MSRNVDQTDIALDKLYEQNISLNTLHPLHLATSFLDGAKSCCLIMSVILGYVQGAKAHGLYRDEYGHTVLDGLMIAIIKSYTSAKPVSVIPGLRDMPCFAGEEVDICGRWDADSPCLRHLHSNGNSSIPKSWKLLHVFLCMPTSLLLETSSGLFVRRCFHCGLKLELRTLHTLIMVQYLLATEGCEDEDLFGILACALCMISHGVNPCATADISVEALLDPDVGIGCDDHQKLSAAGFADKISVIPAISSRSQALQSGWTVLARVLHRCEDAHIQQLDNDCMDGSVSDEVDYVSPFSGSSVPTFLQFEMHDNDYFPIKAPWYQTYMDLGTLWASVQAELLSYRRPDNNHGWIFEKFSMDDIKEQLICGNRLEVGYTKKGLLRAHCACHGFCGNPLVTVSEVVDPNIANIDSWGRAAYGEIPGEG